MRNPYDDDNYGKGDWNRQRDMTRYADNKARINWKCPTCDGSGYIGKLQCPTCRRNVKSRTVSKGGAVTRTVYK